MTTRVFGSFFVSVSPCSCVNLGHSEKSAGFPDPLAFKPPGEEKKANQRREQMMELVEIKAD